MQKKQAKEARALKCDVTKEDEVHVLINETVRNFGNNAGSATDRPSTEMSLSDWNNVVSVNLTGVFLCSRAAARQMMEQGDGGKIVNIASIYGIVDDTTLDAPTHVNLTESLVEKLIFSN